jgi:hypothetical protein
MEIELPNDQLKGIAQYISLISKKYLLKCRDLRQIFCLLENERLINILLTKQGLEPKVFSSSGTITIFIFFYFFNNIQKKNFLT